MVIKKKFSIAIVDIEKIEDVNNIILKFTTATQQYSTYFYFNLNPVRVEDVYMDITFFQLESENQSGLAYVFPDDRAAGERDSAGNGVRGRCVYYPWRTDTGRTRNFYQP